MGTGVAKGPVHSLGPSLSGGAGERGLQRLSLVCRHQEREAIRQGQSPRRGKRAKSAVTGPAPLPSCLEALGKSSGLSEPQSNPSCPRRRTLTPAGLAEKSGRSRRLERMAWFRKQKAISQAQGTPWQRGELS